jgi:hypothetical protein
MGNAPILARKSLNEPMTEACIRSAMYEKDLGHANDIIDALLKGSIPTNFSYQDILELLLPFTEATFVVLPVWTLNLTDVETSAKCMVRHWPALTDEQLQDTSFLSSIRVMVPLFKSGIPIGHARFMFYDNWEPMPHDTLRDEHAQWKEVIMKFLPVPGVTDLIFDYDVLERSEPSCKTPYSCKIIDSLPGTRRGFQRDVEAFTRVIDCIKDPEWCPESWKHEADLKQKLVCVRSFLDHVAGSSTAPTESTSPNTHMEAVVLPSTIQVGLECIIITLCRLISTWVTPYETPLEECQPLCRDKKGRRVISELLLRAKLSALYSEVPVVKQSPMAELSENMETAGLDDERTDSDDASIGHQVTTTDHSPQPRMQAPTTWYSVYSKPTFCVHSSDAKYKPQELRFGGALGYTVYHGCKWMHTSRNQNFLPNQTILSISGVAGCLYICPVYAHVSSQWHFLVLGTPGYSLFRAAGKTVTDAKTGRSRNTHFEAAPPNHGWTPPTTSQEQLYAFIASWSDPTFKQHNVLNVHLADTSEIPKVLDSEQSESTSSPSLLRRSKRKRKQRKMQQATPVTPVRLKKV